MIVSGNLLVPDSSKVFLDSGFRPVYFALKAKVKAFYHIARARIVRVHQYYFIMIPMLNAKLSASSSALTVEHRYFTG